jgi:hypothetical protein
VLVACFGLCSFESSFVERVWALVRIFCCCCCCCWLWWCLCYPVSTRDNFVSTWVFWKKSVIQIANTVDRMGMFRRKRRGPVFRPENGITPCEGSLVPIVPHFTAATGCLPNCLRYYYHVIANAVETALKKGKAFFVPSSAPKLWKRGYVIYTALSIQIA